MLYRTIGKISQRWTRFRSLSEPTNSRLHTRRYSVDPHCMPPFADCVMNKKQKIVLLWIGALCINQNDDGEKTIQVVMMPQIFYKACHVCVWLGEDANRSETMHHFFRSFWILLRLIRLSRKNPRPNKSKRFLLMMRA
jgi:hypothetical protein